MIASTINLTIFIIMIIIYFNELKNVSMFIYNFNYIKDLSKIIMEQKCNNIYCEAETDRYKISQNSYNLLLANDIFNPKTYIILIFIISILIFIYYYNKLFVICGIWEKITVKNEFMLRFYVYSLHILLLAILIGIIIMRYVPYDEAGYLKYFKDNNLNSGFNSFIVLSLFFIFICIISLIYIYDYKQIIIAFCFMFSITLLLNLMNIVLSFRTNTTPILKTKELRWSLKNSLKNIIKKYNDLPQKPDTKVEYNILVALEKDITDDSSYNRIKTINNVSYIINILIAFNELIEIYKKYSLKDDNHDYKDIIVSSDKLKSKISSNYKNFQTINTPPITSTKISDLSLIFDKPVKLPTNYNPDEHKNNDNTNNDDYLYTADISYGNANLFYEKYWNIKESESLELVPSFLKDYSYYTPIFYNYMMSPNLLNIWGLIIGLIVIMILIPIIFKLINLDMPGDISFVISPETLQFLYENLLPLITLSILIIYIISFISFNTTFNKYVVYKCLDCSYKRSLNKLNNIVTPYIRLYDNKKKTGNKNYLHHYIIANVFYSLLNGHIKLTKTGSDTITPDSAKYSNTTNIKSNNYKFANMNNNVLNNDNVFREYYKETFKNIYKNYDDNNVENQPLYKNFDYILANANLKKDNEEKLISYLNDRIYKDSITKGSNLEYIYNIIQRCFELFDENQFNNNLLYYNNPKSKKDGIDVYKNFYFYNVNKNDKIIPYQFILKLDSITAVDEFIKGNKNTFQYSGTMDELLKFNDDPYISIDPTKNNINLQKIIAKFLLILCHINYNKYKYSLATTTSTPTKKEIYERKTRYLYKLFSNTSYNDTYVIDDTFDNNTIPITDEYEKLTYIYNYLETKYVHISSNNNNNYLMNIIKSINKKINDDDKNFNEESKDAQYLFGNYLNKSKDFDNEDEILNIANNISTTSFGITYITNMILLLTYYYLVLKK